MVTKPKVGNLTPESAIYFRDQLREARADAFRNVENYQELLFCIEKLGITLTKEISALGKYKKRISALANRSPLACDIPAKWSQWHAPFRELYETVREARNDALHQGAFARHLTKHASELSLVLEDALMKDCDKVRDFMVRNPVCTHLWQPVSFIRQVMLLNSFSYLPVWSRSGSEEKWHLVPDHSVALYLRGANDRKPRLATSLQDAVKSDGIKLLLASTRSPEDRVTSLLDEGMQEPVLIPDPKDSKVLLGILTAFDLL